MTRPAATYPAIARFTPNGRLLADDDRRSPRSATRPVVYLWRGGAYCHRCASRRSRRRFDRKPLSAKGVTVCVACRREIGGAV